MYGVDRSLMTPKSNILSLICTIYMAFFMIGIPAYAQVAITKATGAESFCVDLNPGSGYVPLSDIVIAESMMGDFTDDAGIRQLVLDFDAAGFEFDPTAGSLFISGAGLTLSSFLVTTTTVTIEYSIDASSTVSLNRFTISNLRVKSTSSTLGARIQRSTVSGPVVNNADLTGLTPGSTTALADMNSYDSPNIGLTVLPDNAAICENATLDVTIVASSPGYYYQLKDQLDNVLSPLILGTGGNLIITSTSIGTTVTDIQVEVLASSPSSDCKATLTDQIGISFESAPSITTDPMDRIICAGNATTFSVVATGDGLGPNDYQWQISTDGGATFTDLSESVPYSGTMTSTLAIASVNAAMSGYLYRVSAMGNCAPNATGNQALLSVNEPPSILSDPSDATICSGGSVSFSVTASGTMPTYQWQVDTGGGYVDLANGGIYSGVNTASLNLNGVSASEDSYGYRAVVMVSCGAAVTSSPSILSVDANPVAFLTGSTSVCSGASADITVSASGVDPFDISYTDGSTTFNLLRISNGHTISVSPTSTTMYQLVSIANSNTPMCTGNASGTATVTVNDLPTGDLTGTVSICSGDAAGLRFDLTGNGPFDATYSDGTSSFLLSGISDGHTINVSPASTTDYRLTGLVDSASPRCTALSLGGTATVTVNDLPTVTLSGSTTICNGNSTLLTFLAMGTGPFDITYSDGSGNVLLSAINSGHQITVSPSVTTTYSIISAVDGNTPGCTTGAGNSVTVIVEAIPIANAGTDTDICGLSYLAEAIPSVGMGEWTQLSGTGTTTYNNRFSPNATISVSDYGSYTFQWTEINGLCSDSDDIIINFYEPPTPSAGTDDETCSLSYTLLASPSVGTGQWTLVNGPGLANFDNDTDAVTLVTVDVYGRYLFQWEENNNNCIVSDRVEISFNEPPLIISVENDGSVLCEPSTILLEARFGGGANNATWSLVSAAAGSLGPSSLTGDVVTAIYTPSPGEFGPLTFRVTTDDSDNSGPCIADAEEITITVNQAPTVLSVEGDGDQFCDPTVIDLRGTVGGSAAMGNWTLISGGTGTLQGSISTAGTVTDRYTVVSDEYGTLTFELATEDPDGLGPCVPARERIQVQVNQGPIVDVLSDYVVCEPVSIPVRGTIGGSATQGNWQVISGNGSLSPSSVSGNEVSALYLPDASDIGTVITLALISDDTDGAGPCDAARADVNITINSSVSVSAGVDRILCEDVNGLMLEGTLSGPPSTVLWSGGRGVFGDAANPLTTYEYHPDEIGTDVMLTLTIADPDGTGPCTAESDEVTVTIHRLPNVVFFNLPPTIAENSPELLLEGNQQGGDFSIAPSSGLGGTFIVPGEGDKVNFIPSSAEIGSNRITYTYTDPLTGCNNTDVQEIFVNELTSIDFVVEGAILDPGANPQICGEIGDVMLFGDPRASTGNAGTEFTSNDLLIQRDGSGNYFFDTNGLTSGIYRVLYTFVNSGGAVSTIPKDIRIFASPEALIAADNTCIADFVSFRDVSTITSPAFSSSIVAWEWDFDDGNMSSQQHPTHTYTAPGLYTVSLTVTTDRGCSSMDTQQVRVGPVPEVNFSWSAICNGDATEFRDMSEVGISNAISYEWDFGDGDILTAGMGSIPSGTHEGRTTGTFKAPFHQYASVGNYEVTLTLQTDDGCSNSKTQKVFILEFSVITPSRDTDYFEDFEEGTGGWVAGAAPGSDTSWVYGAVDAVTIKSNGSTVWWTGANEDSYFSAEDSYVFGPCFDLSRLKRPMVSFDYWSDLQQGFDGAVLQFSTDGGISWSNVGVIQEGQNWYNDQAVIGNPGNQVVGQYAWSGSSGKWLKGSFELDEIPLEERGFVRMRIAFGSDENNPSGLLLNGFAFDNFRVQDRKRNVLVEHFSNTSLEVARESNAKLYNLFDAQLELPEDTADFVLLQYHLDIPLGDIFFNDNPKDPRARALFYGVSEAPKTIVGGNTFNGNTFDIDEVTIEKRALAEPLFDIEVDTVPSERDELSLNITLTATATLEAPLLVHAAVVETLITGSDGVDYRNVVKKLLFDGDGENLNIAWENGTSKSLEVGWNIDVPLYDPTALGLVVFVQNRLTREVYQTVFEKLPIKVRQEITGIQDEKVREASSIRVYPNPANSTLYFSTSLPLTYRYQWEIQERTGVLIRVGNLDFRQGKHLIDLPDVADGVYFVVIKHDNQVVSRRKIVFLRE